MRKQNKNIRKLKKQGRDVNYINIKSTTIRKGFDIVNKIIKTNKESKIKAGLKEELTFNQYVKKLNDFQALSGGKVSNKKLVSGFISAQVRSRTDKQSSTAYDNLIDKFNRTVVKLNQVGGVAEKLDQQAQLYLNVMIDCNLIEDDKEGKYHLVNKPTLNDFLSVSDKYLEIKAALVKYFGDDEYGEAFGSKD